MSFEAFVEMRSLQFLDSENDVSHSSVERKEVRKLYFDT